MVPVWLGHLFCTCTVVFLGADEGVTEVLEHSQIYWERVDDNQPVGAIHTHSIYVSRKLLLQNEMRKQIRFQEFYSCELAGIHCSLNDNNEFKQHGYVRYNNRVDIIQLKADLVYFIIVLQVEHCTSYVLCLACQSDGL